MDLRDWVFPAEVAIVAAATAACAGLGWKAHPASSGALSTEAMEVSTSTAPARAAQKPPLPARPPTPDTLYYSDLGPDTVDITRYPAQQKYNYAIYARVCSQCHGLARSLNVPAVSRAYWEFYVARMRLHTRLAGQARIPKEDLSALIDFLDYDAKVRKVDGRPDFERQQDVLKEGFDEMLRQRIEKYQEEGQPRILKSPQP